MPLRIVRPTAALIAAAAATAVTIAAAPASPALGQAATATSPDGRWRATIRPARGEPGASGSPATSLWITDTRTGATRLLIRGRAAADPKQNTTSLAEPRFSLDGGFVYVEADAYATSPAIHQVRVATGTERYVADGGLIGVLRDGPWRGFLLVQQHRYRPRGGSYDPVVVVRPDGRVVETVPGSDRSGDRAVAPWLRGKGWRAS